MVDISAGLFHNIALTGYDPSRYELTFKIRVIFTVGEMEHGEELGSETPTIIGNNSSFLMKFEQLYK